MKLPFVSRATFDATVNGLSARLDDAHDVESELRAELTRLRDRETALMDQLVKLATPAPKPVFQVRDVDPIAEAISRKAGNDSRLRSHLSFWAREQREKGMDPKEVAACVSDWSKQQPEEPVLPW